VGAQQMGLFQMVEQAPPERGRARRSDPDTSKKSASSTPVADLEARVLRALRLSRDGMTTHELAWLLKIDLVSVSPRMRPLVKKNLVQDSGERRRGDSGRASIVWKAISA
jgi:predicted ArsR family transcriptional regulator